MFAKTTRMNTPTFPSQISSTAPCPTSSHLRILQVLNYTPQIGRGGTTVAIETYIFSHKRVSIRIVIGFKAIYTTVENIQGFDGLWRCTGSVPEFEVHKNDSKRTFPVSIQALDGLTVVDSVPFGTFTYWDYGLPPSIKTEPSESTTLLDVKRPPSGLRALPHHGPQEPITQIITPAHHVAIPSTHPRRLPRRHPSSDQGPYDKVLLNFEAEPTDVGKDLTGEERRRRRRLVRFHCERSENMIRIFFYPIQQEEYEKKSSGVVISCIWREDVRETCFTSCDLIRLLEYLVQDHFQADERSRVRRNIEHLRPMTVSKTRMTKLFNLIMNLPAPKPRKIEKDVKVFNWDRLVECLNSAISKYEWVTVSSSSYSPSPRPAGRRSPLYSLGAPTYDNFNATIQHPRPYHLTAMPSPDIAVVAGRASPLNFMPIPAVHISPPQHHSLSIIGGSSVVPGSADSRSEWAAGPAHMLATPGADDSCSAYSPRGTFLGFDPLGFLRERDAVHNMASQFM